MSQSDLDRRRDRIVTLLSTYGELSAQAMSDMLGVTVQTLRADLRALDDARVVRRRHGGASLVSVSENISYHPRQAVSKTEKARIGAVVAGLLPDGATVALGTGTTVEAVARALAGHEKLTVATNSLHAVMALQAAPGATVFLAGGKLRMRDLDLIGAESAEFFASMRLDHAVFSVGGISEDGALLDFNLDEIRARKAISAAGAQRILVVDHVKVHRPAPHAWGTIADVDLIVCGGHLPEPLRDKAARTGTRIIEA
ncbi:DeoR/GlpR transcriptional regulator [Salipiger pacificus]|uniref:DeoR/GlpR transcriptional regulator n=2 Tax=Salipiger mangrovisoli TaxID=2865933 RepID=A0ABR9X831_9RHOB|nr:DeoR/GlpR transcriptional regulator [Salipiger mangrovisoli]